MEVYVLMSLTSISLSVLLLLFLLVVPFEQAMQSPEWYADQRKQTKPVDMDEKQKTEIECSYWERKMAQRKRFYLEMEAEVLDGSEMKMEDLRVISQSLLSRHITYEGITYRKQLTMRESRE